MKQFVAWGLVLSCGLAEAQELCREIPVREPVPAPSAMRHEVPTPEPVREVPSAGSRKSAQSMSFGLMAGFQSTVVPSAPSTGGLISQQVTGPYAPTVGMKFFLHDSIAMLVELGTSIALDNGNVAVGFEAQLGVDVLFRSPQSALRPLLHLNVGLGKPFSGAGDVWMVHGAVGGGAEYFLSPQLSIAARATIGLPVLLANGRAVVLITTLSPSLMMTFYFDAPPGTESTN